MKDIYKMSSGEPAPVIDVDEKYQKEFFELVRQKGLHYCKTVDFDLTDGKIPIIVPQKELPAFTSIQEAFLKKKIEESEKNLKDAEKYVEELKEKSLSGMNEEDRIKLEKAEQVKEEIKERREETLKEYEEKSYQKSFEEYLKSAKGTEFEKDPDKAIAEYNKGVPITQKEELNKKLLSNKIPESKEEYYLLDNGITIKRTFHEEEEIIELGGEKFTLPLIHSEYSFKTNDGEIHEFTDSDVSKKKWKTEILPKLYDAAGVTGETECRVFQTQEQVEAHLTYFNKVSPLSEQKKVGFNNAEVHSEAENAIDDLLKGMSSAKIATEKVEFSVPQDKLYMENGKVVFSPNGLEGEKYIFHNVKDGSIKNGMLVFSAKAGSNVTVQEKGAMDKNISAEAAKNMISGSQGETTANIVNAMKSFRK